MASTPKKPPATSTSHPPSTARKNPPTSGCTTSNGAPPSRSPSRMAAQSSTPSSNATGSVNRAKSVRSSTPLSARSAARTPASSDADDAKAELQARLDELQDKLAQVEQAYTDSQRQASILQSKLDEAIKEQSILEENVHEHTERIEELENEKRESLRAKRELEQIYEAERAASMKEREEASARAEETQSAMQRLRDTLTHRELRDRTGIEDDRRHSLSRRSSTRSNDPSPNPEARADRQFAPPSSLQRSDSRSSSRLVLQKDKIIEGLRLELAEAQIKLVELENRGGGTLHQLEKDMYDVKMQNARLMEENESFQLLLSEKTLNGDFAQSDLLRAPSRSTVPSDSSRPQSRDAPRQRASLAEELADNESVEGEGGDASPVERKLQTEVSSLKDQNKALTLYINNIISRLLQHEQFEAILDKTPDLMAGPGAASTKYAARAMQARAEMERGKGLPPAPQQTDDPTEQQPVGLLQRAGSVLRRGKPTRPVSQIQPVAPEQLPSAEPSSGPRLHEHPDTAPSIPLGRSTSVRNSGYGHRRANSDWSAANLVTNMYKGPSPGLQGPASPGLTSPSGGARGFFAGRIPSTGSVPIAEEGGNKENQGPQTQPGATSTSSSAFDPRSDRNSVTSKPGFSNTNERERERGELSPPRSSHGNDAIASDTLSNSNPNSNPSSPPRSEVSSSGDPRPSGAIMIGSKPRPLRLVQEAQDDEKAKKAANRGSWFGWMNKATPTATSAGTGTPMGSLGNSFANVGGYMAGRASISWEGGLTPGAQHGQGQGQSQGQGQGQ